MSYKCKRLNLNWQLESKQDRVNFINAYVSALPFKPTEAELDMMSKYILWGKSANGLNGRQEGLNLETSHGTWDAAPVESLDALIESPTFSESMLRSPADPIFKMPKPQFSRTEAREFASTTELAELEQLWTLIDTLELKLSFYELAHNKRTSPIRQPLLNRFSESTIQDIQKSALSIGPYTYLNLKHQLIELRRQQYTIRDFYKPAIVPQSISRPKQLMNFIWGIDINVAPLCLKQPTNPLSIKLFKQLNLNPSDFDEEELRELTHILWTKSDPNLNKFDFCNTEHLMRLDEIYLEGKDIVNSEDYSTINCNLDCLLDTYDAYCDMAELTDCQLDILLLKRQHKSNEYIANFINSKYEHHYTLNYISTLYHKTILAEIARVAAQHRLVCENLFYEENFKRCIDCEQILLKDSANFMKKAKVKDGFDCRCKVCAKKIRDKRKE